MKKYLKFILPIIAFIFIAYGYAPQVFEGKIVDQSDISSWEGMAHEIVTYNQEHPGERTLWTNSMFSGMPATSISVIYKGDFTQYIYDLFFTGARPASHLLISLVGGFLLFLAFGVNVYLAFMGAIAITFCSYNMQIIQVGHNAKMVAIAFMPWVLAAVVHAYRRNAFWGALLFGFALSFQIKANHPQITYYLAMIVIGYGIWQLCKAIREKAFPKFLRTSLMVLAAGLIGIATNVNHLWPTYEYAQHTMRGGTELTSGETAASAAPGKKTRSGLDLDYATQWSYGIEETLNLMIPDFNGGASQGALDKSSDTYKALQSNGYPANQIIGQLPLYWGPQPFTAGPMYMGAVSIFLFILGFFLLQGGIRWWIGGVSLLALLLGWGYHMMPVSEFFFNWAPMYNKFRTVSMIIVILQITIPVLGVLVANELLFGEQSIGKMKDKKKVMRGFCWATGLTAGISLIFILFPSLAGNFASPADAQLPPAVAAALAQDRIGLLRSDAFRTIVFILFAAAALWLGYARRLKPVWAASMLAVLVLVDLWSVDKRYLNDSHFVTKRQFTNNFNLRPVDQLILQDRDPHYRVLDLSVNTFNDAYVSYHHKTIGGYSPVKLQRYQDLIERNISPEIGRIGREFQQIQTIQDAQNALGYHPVLSMLNTKYVILGAGIPPVENTYRLGNAWFVDQVREAQNADEEIALLQETDPATTAVISREFMTPELTAAAQAPAHPAPAADPQTDTEAAEEGQVDTAAGTASVSLKSYAPNRLVYSYSSRESRIVLYSEVYYAPGWTARLYPAGTLSGKTGEKASVAGEPLDIFRANWILRGTCVPAGDYDIEFAFAPDCFRKGEIYSALASGLLLVLLAAGIASHFYKRRKKDGYGKPNL